jgi:hypothetical protein
VDLGKIRKIKINLIVIIHVLPNNAGTFQFVMSHQTLVMRKTVMGDIDAHSSMNG